MGVVDVIVSTGPSGQDGRILTAIRFTLVEMGSNVHRIHVLPEP